MAITFLETARSERHFTALLLPHLLMADNFEGCRALFEHLGISTGKAFDAKNVEIVAELNPVRDVLQRAADQDAASPAMPGQVVPDLFIRIGEGALVVEAKFFTHPPAADVAKQLNAQREVIDRVLCNNRVLCNTEYEHCTFHYLALTVGEPVQRVDLGPNGSWMTWSKIIELMENQDARKHGRTSDFAYALNALRSSERRSQEEAKTRSNEKGRCKSIEELLQQAPRLLEQGNRYIGFEGGQAALGKASLGALENRDHYKFSDRKANRNWLPLSSVIKRYLKLKEDEPATGSAVEIGSARGSVGTT